MQLTRLILVVTAILFLCNFIILLLVQQAKESLIIAFVLNIGEILGLIVAIIYWQAHYRAKRISHEL